MLSEIPLFPAHRVANPVLLDYMASAASVALGAEQDSPLGAQHQHRLGVDDQLRFFGSHVPLLQLFRLQQM